MRGVWIFITHTVKLIHSLLQLSNSFLKLGIVSPQAFVLSLFVNGSKAFFDGTSCC